MRWDVCQQMGEWFWVYHVASKTRSLAIRSDRERNYLQWKAILRRLQARCDDRTNMYSDVELLLGSAAITPWLPCCPQLRLFQKNCWGLIRLVKHNWQRQRIA